jgi:hypothetical protein
LTAAATNKSEGATAKQIASILALLASNTRNIDDKITVINGRLDRGEGAVSGSQDSAGQGGAEELAESRATGKRRWPPRQWAKKSPRQ